MSDFVNVQCRSIKNRAAFLTGLTLRLQRLQCLNLRQRLAEDAQGAMQINFQDADTSGDEALNTITVVAYARRPEGIFQAEVM